MKMWWTSASDLEKRIVISSSLLRLLLLLAPSCSSVGVEVHTSLLSTHLVIKRNVRTHPHITRVTESVYTVTHGQQAVELVVFAVTVDLGSNWSVLLWRLLRLRLWCGLHWRRRGRG